MYKRRFNPSEKIAAVQRYLDRDGSQKGITASINTFVQDNP